MARARAVIVWTALFLVIAIPIAAAAFSPLLAWRQPIYIAAGLSGIAAFALLVLQPLLATGALPGLNGLRGRSVHRWVGAALVATVCFHVGGLWITSPPDVVDALLFASPTPFSAWGVIAMWAVFASALLAVLRRKLRPRNWRVIHLVLAVLIAGGTIIHAVLIEGTMEPASKLLLCAVVALATTKAVLDTRVWSRGRARARRGTPGPSN
ncbi:MAG: ferric reductase-like transmembrane domain-containing protein [Pseudomonadota bacterium]